MISKPSKIIKVLILAPKLHIMDQLVAVYNKTDAGWGDGGAG